MVVRALKFGIKEFNRIFYDFLYYYFSIEEEKSKHKTVDNMLTANIPLKLDFRRTD